MAQLLRSSMRTEGNTLVVDLAIDDAAVAGPLDVALYGHDDVRSQILARSAGRRSGDTWQVRLPLEPAEHRRVLQIGEVRDSSGAVVELNGPHLHLEPAGDGPWPGGSAALAGLGSAEEARARRFNVTLVAPGSLRSDPVFSAVVVADGLPLTGTARVPGIQVLPLHGSAVGGDGAEVLGGVTDHLGLGTGVAPEAWTALLRERRPAVAVHLRSFHAGDLERARSFARDSAALLLGLLAAERGSAPRIVGGVVAAHGDDGTASADDFWVEDAAAAVRPLGGPEPADPRGLIGQWRRLGLDPRLRLWLSLHADAVAERHWEFCVFRCFTLLEAIARDVVPARRTVLGPDGATRLQRNGRPCTTSQPQGRVFALLGKAAAALGTPAESFASPLAGGRPGELWDEVGIWLAVRNAVARRGAWLLPAGAVRGREQLRTEIAIVRRADDGLLVTGAGAVTAAIRRATAVTVRAAVAGQLRS